MDLEKFNCESFKNDVILGNVSHEQFTVMEGDVEKSIEALFIARRIIPEFNGREMHLGITARGLCGT